MTDKHPRERLTPSVWQHTDEICDQFEQAWRTGQAPALREFLQGVQGPERARLLQELLRLDLHHRRSLAQPAALKDYLVLLPEDVSTLQEFFARTDEESQTTWSQPADDSTRSFLKRGPAGSLPEWSAPRFRTLRTHARGGLGQVFVAADLEFDREVALKEIQPDKLHHATARLDFYREGRITGRLEHPNIAPVYSMGQFEDGRPFYVMRFIRGESLKEAIGRLHSHAPAASAEDAKASTPQGPMNAELELRQLLARFVQVCNAVAYAHSRGVIHRDIKPANIMLGDFGETLLVDWGLARTSGDQETMDMGFAASLCAAHVGNPQAATQPGQIKGTPAYMSPEQAQGEPGRLGPATDIYSLGATLYTLLTGKVPVQGKSTAEVLSQVTAGQITPPRERAPDRQIPKALEAVCLKAMAREPEMRYATSRDLADDVERFLADEPVSAYAEPIWTRGRRLVRKHRGLSFATLAIVLVAVIAGPLVAWREGRLRTAAEQDYQLAKQAMDQYVDTVKNAALLNDQLFQPLRLELLQFAGVFYRDLLDRHGEDPARREEIEMAFLTLGYIHFESGNLEEAKNAFTRAASIAEELLDEEPDELIYRQNLAGIYHNLGTVQKASNEPELARASLQKAVAIFEALLAEGSASAEARRELATSCMDLGNLLSFTTEVTEAQTRLQQGVSLLRPLHAEYPRDPTYGDALGNALRSLGQFQERTGDLATAKETLLKAVQVHTELVRQFPEMSDYQSSLSASHATLGHVYKRSTDIQNAKQHLDQAIAIARELVGEHPNMTQYQADLATYLGSLAGLYQVELAQPMEAQASHEEAIAIRRRLLQANPTSSDNQIALANHLSNLGELHRVAKNIPRAKECQEEATRIFGSLMRSAPEVTDYKRWFATNLVNLGAVQRGLGDVEAARASYEQALQLQQSLVKESPLIVDYQYDLAFIYGEMALMTPLDQWQSARDYHHRAVEILETLTKQNPSVAKYQNRLGRTLTTLASTEFMSNQVDSAAQHLQQAEAHHKQALALNPQNRDFRHAYSKNRQLLALAYEVSENHRASSTAAQQYAEYAVTLDDAVFAAAHVCACIPLARNDAALSDDEKTQLIQTYGDAAMAILTRLVHEGIDGQRLTDVSLLNQPDFLPLTLRADYRKLLGELSPAPEAQEPAGAEPAGTKPTSTDATE